MVKKSIFYVLVGVVFLFLVVGSVLVGYFFVQESVLGSESRLIQIINVKDGSTAFKGGDGRNLGVDTEFVQWSLDKIWNDAFIREGKGDLDHLHYLSGWVLFVDGKVYSREIGSVAFYGDEACGTYCSHPEDWGLGIDASNCGTRIRVCTPIFGDEYLSKQSYAVVMMSDSEKDVLDDCGSGVCCYDALAVAGQKYYVGSSGSSKVIPAVEYTRRDTRICFEGSKPVEPPVEVCSGDFAPVCAESGQTFSNKCWLEKSSQVLDCEKECPCEPLPPVDGGVPVFVYVLGFVLFVVVLVFVVIYFVRRLSK